jgi:hypothetical protein
LAPLTDGSKQREVPNVGVGATSALAALSIWEECEAWNIIVDDKHSPRRAARGPSRGVAYLWEGIPDCPCLFPSEGAVAKKLFALLGSLVSKKLASFLWQSCRHLV